MNDATNKAPDSPPEKPDLWKLARAPKVHHFPDAGVTLAVGNCFNQPDSSNLRSVGAAFTDPRDRFSRKLGRMIAVGRVQARRGQCRGQCRGQFSAMLPASLTFQLVQELRMIEEDAQLSRAERADYIRHLVRSVVRSVASTDSTPFDLVAAVKRTRTLYARRPNL